VKTICLALRLPCCVLVLFLALAHWSLPTRGAAGDVDPAFRSDLGGSLSIMTLGVQPDGKVVVEGARARLVRLNPDGSRDSSFISADLPLLNVYLLVYSSEGNWYVSGISKEHSPTPTITRIKHDGELDESFQPQFLPGEEVRAMMATPEDGILYFANVIDTNRIRQYSHIQRLLSSGEIDRSFARVELDAHAPSLLPMPNGQTLVGESFRRVNGEERRNFVLLNADGTVDQSFSSPHLQIVSPTALSRDSKGRILVGGRDKTDPNQNVFVRLLPNGEPDPSFQHRKMDGDIERIAVQEDGRILIAGQFKIVWNSYRGGIALFEADGEFDAGYAIGVEGSLKSFPLPDGRVYAIHYEEGLGVPYRTTIERYLGGASEQGIPIFASGPATVVKAQRDLLRVPITVRGARGLAYQRYFNNVPMPGQTNSVLRIERIDFENMGTYILAAGNSFGTTASAPVPVVVNAAPIPAGSPDPGFDPGDSFGRGDFTAPSVDALLPAGEQLLISGRFGSYQGKKAVGLARLNPDASLDGSFDAGDGLRCPFRVAMYQDIEGLIYLGGSLREGINHVPTPGGVARLLPTGRVDPRFSYRPHGRHNNPYQMAMSPDGFIYVTGCFNEDEDENCERMLDRLHLDGTPDASFSVTNVVHSRIWRVGAQPDGRILVATRDGSIVRLERDGTLDPGFRSPAGLTNAPDVIWVQNNGRIFLAYSFVVKLPQLQSAARLLCLESNGDLNPSLSRLFEAYSFLELPDGSVLVGGFGVRRLLADGTVDPNFRCQTDNNVYAMSQQANGNVFIGGAFTSINRLPRKYLARIFFTEQTPEPFLLGPFFSNGKFELHLPTIHGRTYILETTSKVESPAWTLAASFPGNGSWNTITDTDTTSGNRFYRVRVEK
jgi:uncharacterized delta-60 repeat protein